jgi:hypothetical protein
MVGQKSFLFKYYFKIKNTLKTNYYHNITLKTNRYRNIKQYFKYYTKKIVYEMFKSVVTVIF